MSFLGQTTKEGSVQKNEVLPLYIWCLARERHLNTVNLTVFCTLLPVTLLSFTALLALTLPHSKYLIPIAAPFYGHDKNQKLNLTAWALNSEKPVQLFPVWQNICHNPMGQTVSVNYLKKLRPWMPKITQLNQLYSHDSRRGCLQPFLDTGPLR